MGVSVWKKIATWVERPKTRAMKISLSVIAVLAITVPVSTAYVIKKINDNYQATVAAADAEVLGTTNTVAPTNSLPVVAEEQPVEMKKPATKKPPATEPKPAASESTAEAPVGEQSAYPDTYPKELKAPNKNSLKDSYGIYNRTSASYAAWKVQETYRTMPAWNATSIGTVTNWPKLADESGIRRGVVPRVKSVAVVNDFAVWVEAVNGDKVSVSFYNWGESGAHGIWKDVPATNFSTYIYFQ